MANPRYPQQQERSSPQERKLATLAGLIGLTTQLQGPQLQQQQLNDQQHQHMVASALQLLGLGQQQQGDQATQQFRQRELAQRGDIASQDRVAQQQHWADDAKTRGQEMGVAMATHFGALPGVKPKQALRLGGAHDPALLAQANQMDAQDRAATMAKFRPIMQQVGNVPALESFRTALDPEYPGLFDAMKGELFPQVSGPGVPTAPGAPELPPDLQGFASIIAKNQQAQQALGSQITAEGAANKKRQAATSYIQQNVPEQAVPDFSGGPWQIKDAFGNLRPFYGR